MRQNTLFFNHLLGKDAQHQENWQTFNYLCWLAYKHNIIEAVSTTQLFSSKLLSVSAGISFTILWKQTTPKSWQFTTTKVHFSNTLPAQWVLAEGSASCHSLYGTHNDGGVSLLILMFIHYGQDKGELQAMTLASTWISYKSLGMGKQVDPSLTWGNIILLPEGK